jgi:hypothetical protein
LGVTDGAGWVEAVAAVEAGRPPPSRSVAGVELLSPAGPADGVAAWQVRQVIERWETSGGHTVLDAGRSGPCGGWRAATWADGIVLVARADVAGLAAARRLADEMAPLGLTWRFAVREIPGGFKAAEAADRLGRGDVLRIGHERSLAAGLAHGLAPGDRSVGPLAAAARAVTAAERGTATPEAAACGQRHRAARGPLRFRRRSWGPAPAFNPAAFAEEW